VRLFLLSVVLAAASCSSGPNPQQCAQLEAEIAQNAKKDGLSAAGVCEHPPASFVAACMALAQACGD
jgi:hypothetical protein